MNAFKGAMKSLVLALSAVCLVLAAAACNSGGAESAGPVPSVPLETERPAASPGEGQGTVEPPAEAPAEPAGSAPAVDYVIDLNTGVMTPLPEAIIGSVDKSGARRLLSGRLPLYAASPDGSLLAYVGSGDADEGSLQIFIAGIDGTGVRQVTHEPAGAMSPAWSPDGTLIAYEGFAWGDGNLYVLDVATGASRQITDEGAQDGHAWPQFTPDGSLLLYNGTGGTLQTVPVAGGKSTVFVGPGGGLTDAFNGSLSPDGSLVTYLASGNPLSPDGSPMTYRGSEIGHVGPGRFVANVDGSERRYLGGWMSNPAGTWSPDGSRIVCSASDNNEIVVIDIATGEATPVAEGYGAIWLDQYTLLVTVK